MKMKNNIILWILNEAIEIRTEISESVIKISNIGNHLFILTINNDLYHGLVQINEEQKYIELQVVNNFKVVDIDSCKEWLFIVNVDGNVLKCNENLEILDEINLIEEYRCSRGHNATNCKLKVKNIAVGEYGQLFVTDLGQLWGCGYMPQIGINTEFPKRVNFFAGRYVYSVNVGNDFAIAIVSKQLKLEDTDSDDDEAFVSNCPKCVSASQLTSPASQISMSDMCPLGVKLQGSYDIETTSTSSKNDSSVGSSNEAKEQYEISDNKSEKNIIFRNTEAAKEFLSRQISRMSSVGEEYLVECTEKPTRIIKENMTNVASFVYEGVKTVGDKVVTLSRHVSGSSDCNSTIENNELQLPRSNSRDDFLLSVSQCTSEKDLSEHEMQDRVNIILTTGSNLLNCEVWTWGNIIHGQLGIGDKMKRERPMIITKLSNIGVRKASVQSYHTAVLTLDGRAFIWGQNDYNQVTIENNIDQSSPKLVTFGKDERIKDIVCGAHCTTVLNSKQDVIYFGKGSVKLLPLYSKSCEEHKKVCVMKLLNSSMEYTILNFGKDVEQWFLNYLVEEQKILEEMLSVQLHLIKPLQKKSANSSNAALCESLCKDYTDLLHFWSANIQSLHEYSNELIPLSDIVVFKYYEEHIFVYKNYLNTTQNIISIDGFHHISKLIDVSQNLYKLRPDSFTKKDKNNEEQLISLFLLAPVHRINNYIFIVDMISDTNKHIVSKWKQFVEENKTKQNEAEVTKEFWLNSGKSIDYLKSPTRRLIRDSHKYPINLLNSSRFSSHWFILFSDLFAHINGSSSNLFNLTMIWIEPLQEETSQQYQICLKMPEDTLMLYTTEPEAKIEWYHILQQSVKLALKKPDANQPPLVRTGCYTFTKNGFLKDAKYSGRWLNAKMHGTGKLEWPDGRIYTGQFSNNQLSGYGVMEIPNVGVYEGQWKENQQNGIGTFTYSNTDIYKGHFKDGVPHGHGFLRKGNFMANTASLYIGDWVMGLKCGYGVMDDIVTGEKYIGNWVDNKKHGNGLIVTSDGIYYEGIFNQDILTGHGIMILEDGTHYEGEFRGTGILYGKGTLTLPSGHVIEGNLSGSWNEGIKINGTFLKNSDDNKLPKSFELLCTPVYQKWKALFKHCHQVIGIPENNTNKNGTKSMDTQKIWQNVAVYLSNSTNMKRNRTENKLQNSLNHLDIIPPFGRDKLDMESYLEIKNYLTKAFESNFHPLGCLLNNFSEAYTTTYGGKVHPLLLTHAITELIDITKRLYEIVRFLFPALPAHGKECFLKVNNDSEEIISYQSLLYPIMLPKVHNPLFTLLTLKNEVQERQYKKKLMEWNKQSDQTLMAYLSVDQKFFKTKSSSTSNYVFIVAVETLQQIKSMFSPTEKLNVIRETIEKMTPVAKGLLGQSYVWNMDDLFPLFLYIVVRARLPDLGAELEFIEKFMDPSLENGELGIMFTTLKACYQQILQEKASNF